ncbi:hypothetical protein SAMN04488023_10876 [Pedobacter rhizosphaerae]|uniref:Uncharacterized protein n=1 Tax=Pedobacter rhizosphaerae TaxID=390241 RepID=A0A1H9NR89_9SPHI|nr:hypothetical protein SAMN04488023_10876 [Pedobacter rhizosphaerae]
MLKQFQHDDFEENIHLSLQGRILNQLIFFNVVSLSFPSKTGTSCRNALNALDVNPSTGSG